MKDGKNPCYIVTPISAGNYREMTVFETPKLGRFAVPTHLLNTIHCPTGATLLIAYSSVTFKVTGRNLGLLLDLLVIRRLETVTAVDELAYCL